MTIELDRDNPRHRALARLVIANRDWSAAAEVLRYIVINVKNSYDPLYYPLTAAAVVCYARPFLGGRSHSRISRAFERFPENVKRANHERLLTYRSVVIAHANDEKHEVTLIQKGTVIDWDNGKGKGTLTEHSEMIRGPELARGTIPHFLHLVEFQLERIKAAIDRETDALFP
ncbi:MAG: hypothetical protein ACJ8KF_03475 [Chthoniobacterales bacterium]